MEKYESKSDGAFRRSFPTVFIPTHAPGLQKTFFFSAEINEENNFDHLTKYSWVAKK
jgi:hypothetical protein